MRRSTFLIAILALVAAGLWHLPPAPLHAAEAAPPELITFDQYREFRMRITAQRQERLAQQLAASDITATQRESAERRKAYYDRLATMSPAERDALFRTRFDQIDANHDGKIDPDERAAWRAKQSARYRQLAVQRSRDGDEPR